MRYGRRLGVSALLLLLAVAAAGAEPAATDLLRRGIGQFMAGTAEWSYPALTNAVAIFDHACRADPDGFAPHYWKGAALFHVLLHRLGEPRKPPSPGDRHRLMDDAVASLERAVQLVPDDSESHALLSTIHGLRIAERPGTALWRGPRVRHHQKLALRGKPATPRAYYLLGMSHIHAPGILGGRRKALGFLLEAERLFAAEQTPAPDPLKPVWGRDHCLAFIGQTYFELGDLERAEAYYRQALQVNARHGMAVEGLQRCRKGKPDESS